ncbi:MAG TPA: hypothetical protein VJK73_01090 [Candidatus Paceibacterota bacterium]
MRTVGEHLDRVREQPHHIRRRFALGTAGALTALIGIVWLGASLATGTFALKGSNFAEVTGAVLPEESSASQDTAAVDGVAAAAAASTKRAPAHVEVVPSGTGMPTKTPPPPGPTIIPF